MSSKPPGPWPRLAVLFLLTTLLAWSPSASAQTRHIPTVDDLDASDEEALSTPEERLAELTISLYEAVNGYVGECPGMAVLINDWLDENGEAVKAAADELTAEAGNMSEEEIAELAAFLAVRMDDERVREAQDRLYLCLRSATIQGKKRAVEKAMRRFYAYHKELVLEIVGPVD